MVIVVATRKITITLPEEALERLQALARAEGLPLSTYFRRLAEHRIRIEDGLAAMREWEAEYGSFTPDELERAAARIEQAERQRLANEALAS